MRDKREKAAARAARPGQVGAGEYNRGALSRQPASPFARWHSPPAASADSRRARLQETFSMTPRFAVFALLLVLFAGGCSSSGGGPSETQEKFGVRMAKMNLWREAMFRFRRAVEMNPEDAMAHNNLAVALEANGDFEGAGKAYREAMRLDKSNQFIQKNYSRFVEFTTRDRRRQQRRPPSQTAATAATPQAAPPGETPPRNAPDEPSKPAAVTGGEPAATPSPAEAADPEDGDPAPTAAAPAATPAPNPAPPPTPPPQSNTPPGGQS